ncbi:hypothetical protein SAMN05444166_7129 [Singulisphaera sp. GP187]|uniref:hypothetical protein n=1 Tax=Singulisphaera sp. GP187 TaxID=1882752 RepID=UPI00092CA311|nr:hypothetical protein [Singulisphaera sp. GP187]SIO62718.1 hypothetical protein SAMN05444166_7129 [Singulisphaera sp. GP187]
MSTATIQLDAGGLLLSKTRVDADATEQVVARTYHHPALGERPVIRLASDRLGAAEDLAMEFLGFEPPVVSKSIAVQQRRSLGFAAWALINDPGNAHFALELVKRMKAAARQARSKPGHAWDAYTEMAKDLGRSAAHFLPPFWEEAGRAFKDLGNPTYAGRALTKSLEAERVHALQADRARRRDVVLEFVLSGCLSGNALSEYGNDLQSHYSPQDAFAIFRDLCTRRTRGGMAPWATMPKDFIKLAKAAGLEGDAELEKWLEEVIDSPAMGRPPHQFWKTCGAHCKRIVARSPAFAVALLRHTRPEPRFYGESKLGPWFELLEEWGVFEYLWEDEHRGAPPLGEPIAEWFGRVVRDEVPAPTRTLLMLGKLAPRLREEGVPLALSIAQRYRSTDIDIDVLEACLVLGIKVADPSQESSVTFSGWLSAIADHPFRNQDIIESAKDERFQSAISQALDQALTCRGGAMERGYRQSSLEQRAFPLAAGDRPGIKGLWHRHASRIIAFLEESGLASFEMAQARLESTLWPDTLRLFPDIAERLRGVEPVVMLQRTLRAGVFDEYGLLSFEEVVAEHNIKTQRDYSGSNLHLTFPSIVVSDKVRAYAISGDGTVKEHELRLPKKCELGTIIAIGDDLAVAYRDEKHQGLFFWVSNPAQKYEATSHFYYHFHAADRMATPLEDGTIFLGQQAVRPGDKLLPQTQTYVHDGTRFWRMSHEYDQVARDYRWKIGEVDPRTGKQVRESIPPWFEETEGGTLEPGASELMQAPAGAEHSPLGMKDGMLGWKAVKRRDGSYFGIGIDGRRWDRPLRKQDGSYAVPVALLRQPATKEYLPVTTTGGRGDNYWLWDPSGSVVVATLENFDSAYAHGQVTVLPLLFWHLLKVRDEASSRQLRGISRDDCATLFNAASEDRARKKAPRAGGGKEPPENPLTSLLPAVKQVLPTAPERLVIGVARTIEQAEQRAAAFAALRDKASADATKETTSAAIVLNRKSDLAAAHWGLPAYRTYGADGSTSVSEHLQAAAEFLKGDSEPGHLPRTKYHWFSMLEKLPVRCWQTYWRTLAAKLSQKDGGETPWLEFLKLWHDLGIAALPGQFDILEGYPEGAKKRSWGGYDVEIEGGTSFAVKNGEDRFIVVENETYHQDQFPYQFLRYSTAKTPGTPPGYQIKKVRKIKAKHDPAESAAFIAAAESCTKPPLPSKQELDEAAESLAVAPAEIGLVWMGGLNIDSYEHNFLPAALRTELGWKAADANVGRQALRNLDPSLLEHLCETVVAEGCAAPFADDRGPVLRLLEAAWRAKMPKRLQLDAALQARLSTLGRSSRWQRVEHGELLAVAADPTKHPLLQPREIRIGVAKDRNSPSLELVTPKKEPLVEGDFLRSLVQLVALVLAETPAGHPSRAEMPALIKQVTKLLDHPGTLLQLREIHLYDDGSKKPLNPVEWLNKHVGKTKADAKAGTVGVDDGLIVAATLEGQNQALLAFRPAKLKDGGDLARLLGLVAIKIGEGYEVPHDTLPTRVVIKSPGFQKLAKAILAKAVPQGQWPQNPSHTALDVVQGIQEKHKLGEDAAGLYAQLLTLPDPTTAKVCAWNGWTAGRFKKAAVELVGRKLVLEASRARAGRSHFLPGEWVELKAPWLPIERWKLAHLVELDMDLPELCPGGGPLVLRPFEDLFAAAWQRVVAGDEPRYEEVKRKAKSK